MQVARALKIEPRNVTIKVTARYRREGSVIQNDAKSFCEGITTELQLDCDEPPQRIAQLIGMAEATCYTLAALRNPADVQLLSTVNGTAFDLKAVAAADRAGV